MYYLIIDTCVWIELARKFPQVREKISHLVDSDKARLILPQVVVDEWDEHKQAKVVETEKQSIRGKIKNAMDISQYLSPEDADEFVRILDEFRQRDADIESIASEEVAAIERLFDHSSTIRLPMAEKVRLQAVDLALAKKAPFKNKNSMADALIVLSAIDYAIQESLTDCIFVSDNTQDFSSDSDIHPDLEALFNECGMRYFSNIGQAINEIEENLVRDEDIKRVEALRIAQAFRSSVQQYEQISRSIAEAVNLPAVEAFRSLAQQQEQMSRSIAEAVQRPAVEEFNRLAEQLGRWSRSMAPRRYGYRRWKRFTQSVLPVLTVTSSICSPADTHR